jgi:NAD(P)H-nitrite reductase large subunit
MADRSKKTFYSKPGEDPVLKILTGVRVQSLDRKTQSLHLENQERVRYERLILAPGGRSIIPRLEGADSLENIRHCNIRKRKSFVGCKDQRVVYWGWAWG